MSEFHIARRARDKYNFQEELFSTRGNVSSQSFHEARLFVQKINEKTDLVRYPERAMRAGQLNAIGLIEEILHSVIQAYETESGIDLFEDLLQILSNTIGSDLDETLIQLTTEFPPREVYQELMEPEEYLGGFTDATPNRAIALENLLLLWLANSNPAFDPYKELFDDAYLRRDTAYKQIVTEIRRHFQSLPPFGPDEKPLFEMLQGPATADPDSLSGQLQYIREHWGTLVGRHLVKLLSSLDLLREEGKNFSGGPGPAQIYTYSGLQSDAESFTPDTEWMPRVVLIAKSTLVWLDQLSSKYRRPVERLDEIPDEEIDALRDAGFSALWLIGLWERSPASKRIKQLCGNPEAEGSAYSILSYNVARELGGWEALAEFRERCFKRGIRLACDMVPNHTGIDSEWIINRPERFIQSPYPPFPGYTYEGENLSSAPQVGIYLEDHYYDRTDAAVTFKRVDFNTGEVRYVYHGNDGTHTPWNDTAQLNYLDPKVREAVIETILRVAESFPIIRFDAAMTLARQHIQRLWYPVAGSGGDIPSRAEHSMSPEDFDRAVPREFWREVVDRVQADQRDTLLLAEAFWMMEGYFVRSLGMHRVYNSAFMNMLKDEENAEYRATIKNTLEFDPEILKRFVNFLNNPDEETAAKQFGDGDKYFGVCALMVTMPGLPMFGHGQIEGLREKYGMEYRRAKWEENPNAEVIERHRREIFPLIKMRYLFAEADRFRLYDLRSASGAVNESTFAYTNRHADESALVLFNNSHEPVSGRINVSASFMQKDQAGRTLQRETIGAALGLHGAPDLYTVFYEQRCGLWFLRRSREILEEGFFVQLAAYQSQIFLRFREVEDTDLAHYRKLEQKLAGSGTADIDSALREIIVEPIHAAFARFMSAATITAAFHDTFDPSELREDYRRFLHEGCAFSHIEYREEAVDLMVRCLFAVRSVRSLAELNVEDSAHSDKRRPKLRPASDTDEFRSFLRFGFDLDSTTPGLLVALAFLRPLARLLPDEDRFTVRSLVDEWMLTGPATKAIAASGARTVDLRRISELIRVIPAHAGWYWDVLATGSLVRRTEQLFEDEAVQAWLGENRFDGVLWFNREAFIELVWWLFVCALVAINEQSDSEELVREHTNGMFDVTVRLMTAMERSGYRVEDLISALRDGLR